MTAALDLLARACLGPAADLRWSELAEPTWREMVALAGQHGVRPLLWLRLRDQGLPEDRARELRAMHAWFRATNQVLLEEQRGILDAMGAAGVAVRPLKGVGLALDLYGDLGAREIVDIDLLIGPGQFDEANEALAQSGYEPWPPGAAPRFGRAKEITYRKATRGVPVMVDLHQRLFTNQDEDLLTRQVRSEGWSSESLLIYLCLHTAAHRYAGICHMCDLDALLRTKGENLDWDAVDRIAGELDLGPSVGLALGLLTELKPVGPLLRFREVTSRWRCRVLRAASGPGALDVVGRETTMGALRRVVISLAGATPRGAFRFLRGAIAPPGADLEAFRQPGEKVGVARLYGRRLWERLG